MRQEDLRPLLLKRGEVVRGKKEELVKRLIKSGYLLEEGEQLSSWDFIHIFLLLKDDLFFNK